MSFGRSPVTKCAPFVLAFVVLCTAALAAPAELGFSRAVTPGLIVHYERLFGSGVRARLEGWKHFVRVAASRDAPENHIRGESDLLLPVNRFFNGVPSATDRQHWGVEDYWATPIATSWSPRWCGSPSRSISRSMRRPSRTRT
jgi:predicted transglutaminase-like cysteine proteinase